MPRPSDLCLMANTLDTASRLHGKAQVEAKRLTLRLNRGQRSHKVKAEALAEARCYKANAKRLASSLRLRPKFWHQGQA